MQAKEKMKQMVSSEGSTSNGEALSVRGRTQKNQIILIEARARMAIMAVQSQETRMKNSASIARKTLISYPSVLN